MDTAAALGSEAISVHYLGNRGEHGTMSTSNGYDGTVRPPLQASWPRASDPDALPAQPDATVRECIDHATAQGVALTIEPLDPSSLHRATTTYPDLQLCMDPAAVRFAPRPQPRSRSLVAFNQEEKG